jgi:hypothetical protein
LGHVVVGHFKYLSVAVVLNNLSKVEEKILKWIGGNRKENV